MTSTETQDTRQRIRDAAARVFSREGFEPASVRSIAEEDDIAGGPIYNRSRDKDGPLRSIFEGESHQRLRFLERRRQSRLPVWDRVQWLLEEGWIRPCRPKLVPRPLLDLVQTMTACRVFSDPDEADEMFAAAPKEMVDLMWKGLRRSEDS